jgi:3-phytase
MRTSLALLLAVISAAALAVQPAGPIRAGTVATVTPLAETDPVPNEGDAADDPAIWLHPTEPSLSTIIATDKEGGLAVYGLTGDELQYRPDGDINNVDLHAGFPLGGQPIDLVAATDRSNNTFALYSVDAATRTLEPRGSVPVAPQQGYGICLYESGPTGDFLAFVTTSQASVMQYRLFDGGGGEVESYWYRNLPLASTAEGCVADDALGYLYVAEEEGGVWRFAAEPDQSYIPTLVDSTQGGHLTADVEGLAVYATGPTTGYLIASSQGSDSFVVYDRQPPNDYIGTFSIEAGGGFDGVSGTDGIAVTNAVLGPSFIQGLFVAQDGVNTGANQNFKIISWAAIADALGLAIPLDGDTDCAGAIDALDAALVLQHVASLVTNLGCPPAADVNNDGVTGALDALLILQMAAGGS